MNFKTTLKSSVAVAALFAVAAPVANAADDTLKSGNKNSLTVSGQVVRAISVLDDGQSSEVVQTGGDYTASRVRWVAQGSLSANVTAGATIEMDVPGSNKPGNMTTGDNDEDGVNNGSDSAWTIRHEYVWVNHKKFGKISLGQTDSASNGRSQSDYSGTTIFGGSVGKSYGQGIVFVNTTTATAPAQSSVTVGEAFNDFDGASRTDVLRYDTPRFYGLQLAVSTHSGGDHDVAADYQGKFGPVKVRAQAGYLDYQDHASKNFQASGSLAVMHDSGLNASFSIGKLNYAGPGSKSAAGGDGASGLHTQLANNNDFTEGVEDPNHIYFSIGYQAKIFGVGGTNFNFKWQETNDLSQDTGINDSEAQAIGVAVVQNFDAIGASIGLEYMNYSLDANDATNTAIQFDDVDVFTLMTVFKF